MTTRIYRIESPFGTGLYQRDLRLGKNIGQYDLGAMAPIDMIGRQFMGEPNLARELTIRGKKKDPRPAPGNDGIVLKGTRKAVRRWYYGFKDLNQLKGWFEDKVSAKDIIDLGLVIRVLDVEHVRHGRCQVVYHKNSVRRSFVIANGELLQMYRAEEIRFAEAQAERTAREKELRKLLRESVYGPSLSMPAIVELPPAPIVLDTTYDCTTMRLSAKLTDRLNALRRINNACVKD